MLVRLYLLGFIFIFLCFSALQAQNEKKYRVLKAETVYFNSGAAKVEHKYQDVLENIGQIQLQYPKSFLWIHAHTDSIGSIDYNEKLAEQRAEAVVRILKQVGADTNRIEIRTYGPYSPLASNETLEGRAENRRVSIHLVQNLEPNEIGNWGIIKGQIIAQDSKRPLEAEVIVTSLSRKDSLRTDANGFYTLKVEDFNNTEIRVYAKGYFFMAKVCRPLVRDTLEQNFQLQATLVGGKIMLSDLYFHMGTAKLMAASEASLEGVYNFLQMESHLRVELGGHVNRPNEAPIAETDRSFILSEQRAKAVYDYLLAKGISADRITYKGYGNWEMIYPRAQTPVEEMMNRRVELKIIE